MFIWTITMKKNLILAFAIVLFCMISQALAQQRLSDWVASLGDVSAPSTAASAAHKRVAFIFSQTHCYDPDKEEFVLDNNFIFRLGNYIQVKSALNRYGKFDAIGSLVGPDLRKNNVKKVFQLLKQETRPGDEIFIYWESHGATDEGGEIFGHSSEESDGMHEFLFLGIPARDEFISDDEFAQLLLILKERRVMVLMEACHSGGLLSSRAQGRTNRSILNALKSININSVNDSESFVEKMDKLCGEFDYASIKPLLSNIMAESRSAFNSSSNRRSLSNFVKNKSDKNSKFFKNAFRRFQTKDINPDHPNLSVIFSASETENSYCALINSKSEILVYNLEENRWLTEEKPREMELPVGAIVFSLVLALSDTTGQYSSGDHTDFADVWKLVKFIVPLNNDRLDSNQTTSERNGSQTPQYLNNTGPINVRPAR